MNFGKCLIKKMDFLDSIWTVTLEELAQNRPRNRHGRGNEPCTTPHWCLGAMLWCNWQLSSGRLLPSVWCPHPCHDCGVSLISLWPHERQGAVRGEKGRLKRPTNLWPPKEHSMIGDAIVVFSFFGCDHLFDFGTMLRHYRARLENCRALAKSTINSDRSRLFQIHLEVDEKISEMQLEMYRTRRAGTLSGGPVYLRV